MEFDKSTDNILYEMFMYAEWKPDPEILKADTGRLASIIKSPPSHWLRYFQVQQTLNEMIISNITQRQSWQIALGDNGKVIAVLADTVLEIRTKRGDYSSIVSRAKVPRDLYPQWRKLVWSPDCSLLAIAHSNGVVDFYDLTAANIFNIPADCSQPAELKCNDRTHAVASIVFVPVRVKDNKWSNEVLIIDYRGALRSFSISPTDGVKLNHNFSFEGGVAFCTYNQIHNVLYVAGLPLPGEKNPKNPSFYGLAAWRLIIDAPFYKLSVASNQANVLPNTSYLWSFFLYWNKSQRSVIFDFAISPGGGSLICLHSNGDISLWHLPALRMIHLWPLTVQPQSDLNNPLNFGKTLPNDFDYFASKAAWWNNEAVIIARNNGAVSICRLDDFQNLLGEKPAFLQGCPQVTEAFQNTFLALECELKPMTVNELRKKSNSDNTGDSSTTSSFHNMSEISDTQLEPSTVSVIDRSVDLFKTLIFFITDMERFQPKPKKITVVSKVYRLLGLKSTTPIELYLRKIESQSYPEALTLAEKYGLDFDLVYQQKWRKSRVSLESIKDSLVKVTKSAWIVHQCCDRLAETLTAAKELLNFGLEVTEKEIINDLRSNNDSNDPVPTLEQLKLDDLTLYTTELLRCRHLMLFYIDRLNLYDDIIQREGLPYSSEEYQRLRNGSILKCAIDYAREGRIIPLVCLWPMLNHQGMKFTVLNNLPETINPQEYRNLMPNDIQQKAIESKLISRKKDWCEEPVFSSIWSTTWSSDSTPEFEDETILSDSVNIAEWFTLRAIEIENLTGLTNNALALIKIGKEMDVQDLNELYNNLLVLDILIYDLGVTTISLKQLQECSHLQICHHLMSKTTKETFVLDLKKYVIPYSSRQDRFLNLPAIEFNLLKDYLINLSKDDLTFPTLALQNRLEFGLNVKETVTIGEQCLANYTQQNQLPLCYSIFYAFPRESDDTVTPGYLMKIIDDIEKILSACTILDSHSINVTYSELTLLCTDVKQIYLTLKQMTQNVTRVNKSQTGKYDWEGLLSDILDLRTKVFTSADLEICYEIYASALLSSGDINSVKLAASVLTCSEQESTTFTSNESKHCKVPLMRSTELILKASKDYFNSASALNDASLELARTCLMLIECDDKEIAEELDMLSSLKILYDFGLQMLPVQVRLCNDKMSLIEECLESYKYAYQSDQKLLQLARYLRLAGNDERSREALILECVGTKAISDKSDSLGMAAAASAAARLAAGRHSRGWKLAWQVASEMNNIDRDLRLSLLAFSLLHCSPENIQDMLRTRINLESELLQERLGQTMEVYELRNAVGNIDSQDSVDSNEEEFNDALTSPSTEDIPVISIQRIDKHLRNISSNFYNTHWKKPFSLFIKNPSHDEPLEQMETNNVGQTICQEFYRQIYPFSYVSNLMTHYDKFAMPESANKHLNLYISLLRIKTIEDCLNLGRNVISLDEVLSQSSVCAISEDTTLSLSLLLTAKAIDSSTYQNVEIMSKSTQYIYIKMYCTMLKALLLTHKNVFLFSPKKILQFFTDSKKNDEIKDILYQTVNEYMRNCFENLKENVQNEKLKEINSNVNLILFSSDPDYRTSCILGLVRTVNRNNLNLALELSDKHKIPKFDLCITHAEYLLSNYQTIGYDECTAQLTSPEIFPTLKENATIFFQRFSTDIWNKVDGIQHKQMILFFTMIELVCGNLAFFGIAVKDHIKHLKKIKSTSCDLDYKLLLHKPSSNTLIEHIVPLLRVDNVGLTMKLLRTLSASLNIKLDLSKLYMHWLLKLFFNIPEHIDSSKKWMQQFRECSSYFNKMTKSDIVTFVREICFSSIGTRRVPVATRSIIVKQTMDYFHFESVELNAAHNKVGDPAIWEEPKSELNKMSNFLDAFLSSGVKNILSKRPDLLSIWRQLECSYGNEDSTVDTLNYLVLKEQFNICDINKLIKELDLQIGMDNFIKQLLESHQDNQEILKTLIMCIIKNSDEDTGVSKHVLSKIKLFATGKFKPSEEWIRIIFMCKDSDLTDEKNSQLLNQYTHEMINSQWDGEISLEDADFTQEKCRLEIILKLLSPKSLSGNKLKVLMDLFNYWPTFKTVLSNEENPYLLLVQKLLEDDDDDNANHLKMLFESHLLSLSGSRWVVENTPNACVKQLLRLILLSKDKTLYDLIPYYLSKSNNFDNPCDDNLSELIIKEKLVVKFVNTSFYPSLIQFLMTKSAADSVVVKEIIDDLSKAQHHAEALALQLTLNGVPPSLKAFSVNIRVSSKK